MNVEEKYKKAILACKKLREQNRALQAANKMLEDNMGALLVSKDEDTKYYRKLEECMRAQSAELKKLIEVNGILAGKLSVYEKVKRTS